MKQVGSLLALLGLVGVVTAQTTSIDTIIANLSQNLDRISTYQAESKVVQWFT